MKSLVASVPALCWIGMLLWVVFSETAALRFGNMRWVLGPLQLALVVSATADAVAAIREVRRSR